MLPVVANPTAGSGKSAKGLRLASAAAEAAGISLDVSLTESAGHATELAQRAVDCDADMVAVLGGDGTIREVASALAGTETTLALLPNGSGNDFARSIGVPRSMPGAIQVLQTGVVRPVDVARETAGIFACVGGVGFAAEVSHEAARSRLFKGSAAYFAGVFKALARLRPVRMRLRLDDRELDVEAVFVMAQNTPYCGGGQLMAPDARIDDGLLDVVVVTRVGRLELVRTFPKVYTGAHGNHPAVSVYRTSSVQATSDAPVRKMLDGDVVGEEPMSARIQPGALRVLVPSSFVPSSSSAPSSP